MISFKVGHSPKDVILYAVFFYVRYAVSYRDLEDILAERGVKVDPSPLNHWVVRYSPLLATVAKSSKNPGFCRVNHKKKSWQAIACLPIIGRIYPAKA